MQASTFGRKGTDDSEMARRREAFIASERARNGALQEDARLGAAPPAPDADQVARDLGLPADRRAYAQPKSMMLAYVLWFFACAISAHRFYLGAYQSALMQLGGWFGGLAILWAGASTKGETMAFAGLIVMGASGLWMLVDVFLIPGLVARTRADPARAFA